MGILINLGRDLNNLMHDVRLYTIPNVRHPIANDWLFDHACNELNSSVVKVGKAIADEGYSMRCTKNAPESFEALMSYKGSKIIPILSDACENTIYHEGNNLLFRLWHDLIHIENAYDFSREGEYNTALMHLELVTNFKHGLVSDLAVKIMAADTIGQVEYYYRNKKFVNNQKAFVRACIDVGIQEAIKQEW